MLVDDLVQSPFDGFGFCLRADDLLRPFDLGGVQPEVLVDQTRLHLSHLWSPFPW